MILSEESVQEFQEMYLKEYQIKLDKTEATEYGNHLINLVSAVYGNNFPRINTIDNKNNEVEN